MPRTEIFKFDIGDPVIIREIQRPGKVEALTIDYLGPQYRVTFWDNGDRKSIWLTVEEIESRKI